MAADGQCLTQTPHPVQERELCHSDSALSFSVAEIAPTGQNFAQPPQARHSGATAME